MGSFFTAVTQNEEAMWVGKGNWRWKELYSILRNLFVLRLIFLKFKFSK